VALVNWWLDRLLPLWLILILILILLIYISSPL